MSRCFPFPPPGYSGSNEALILSIKLQQEKEKSASDRAREKSSKSSEKKKDKKEKKEKKREERRGSSDIYKEKQKLVEKLYQADKSGVEPKGKCILQQDVTGLLEKSSITEEHGRPYVQNVTSSSDSTGNSSKRKRPSTPPSGIQSNGNVIRIRFSSSQKRDEPSTSGSKEHESSAPLQRKLDHAAASYSKVQPCSNITKTQPSVLQSDSTVKPTQDLSHSASTSNYTAIPSAVRQDKSLPSLPGQKTESVVVKEKLSSHEKKLRKKESKYNKLFENWAPLPLENGLVVDDEDSNDWLFGKNRTAKRLKSSNADGCGDNPPSCASYALQPRAHMLAEADIYALPFTVPF